MSIVQTVARPAPDLAALKARQQGAWSSGDYAVIGTTLQIVGEQLCEALDLRAGQRVLDVAAGNGNATLAAARRWCEVTSTDYVPALLERGRERAAAERLTIEFQEADAEALPFADASFDAVLSTFGVMFTPDQDKAAAEMLRVCRPGGRIGLANWTPDGFIGQMFKMLGQVPAAARRRAVAGAVGHARRGSTSCSAAQASRDRGRAAHLHVPLSLAGAFARRVPHLLRPDAQGVRRARQRTAQALLRRDLLALIGRVQPRRRRHDGGARRVSRSHRPGLIAGLPGSPVGPLA